MFKVAILLIAGLTSFEASARSIIGEDQQNQFYTLSCAKIAENYALGELRDRGMTPHHVNAEVFPFIADHKGETNIYSVLVRTQVSVDIGLIGEGPKIGFNCFVCPNLMPVVTKETKIGVACENEQR